MCPMALKTEVVAAIIYVAVLFGIEIKIYVFTFWVAAGGSGLKWIKTLVRLLVRQAAAVYSAHNYDNKTKMKKTLQSISFSWSGVQPKWESSWQLLPSLGKTKMCVILFSPHIPSLYSPQNRDPV